MSAVSPDLAGNRAARMFEACWDGVLPAVNLLRNRVPTPWASTVTKTMATSQATRTKRRRS